VCVQPITSFLLKRPKLELNDVPMFYSMFNHGGQYHKARRKWTLQFVGDGLQLALDHKALARRHVYGIFMTFASSAVADPAARLSVLRVRRC